MLKNKVFMTPNHTPSNDMEKFSLFELETGWKCCCLYSRESVKGYRILVEDIFHKKDEENSEEVVD